VSRTNDKRPILPRRQKDTKGIGKGYQVIRGSGGREPEKQDNRIVGHEWARRSLITDFADFKTKISRENPQDALWQAQKAREEKQKLKVKNQKLWNPDHSINYTCFFSKKLCKNTDLCYNYPKYKQWRQKRLYSPL